MTGLAVKELAVVNDGRTILDRVSFTATRGQIVALVGPIGTWQCCSR